MVPLAIVPVGTGNALAGTLLQALARHGAEKSCQSDLAGAVDLAGADAPGHAAAERGALARADERGADAALRPRRRRAGRRRHHHAVARVQAGAHP